MIRQVGWVWSPTCSLGGLHAGPLLVPRVCNRHPGTACRPVVVHLPPPSPSVCADLGGGGLLSTLISTLESVGSMSAVSGGSCVAGGPPPPGALAGGAAGGGAGASAAAPPATAASLSFGPEPDVASMLSSLDSQEECPDGSTACPVPWSDVSGSSSDDEAAAADGSAPAAITKQS